MPIYKGNTKIVKLYKGSTQIVKRYKGTDLIYSASRLPAEFQEVEYIESTRTQYINTQIVGSSRLGLVDKSDIEFTQTSGNYQFQGFGAINRGHYGIDVDGYYTLEGGIISTTSAIGVRRKLTATYLQSSIELDIGGIETIARTGSDNAPIPTEPYTLLGALASNYRCIAKLYSCKIYSNSVLIRNFVPCYRKADNVAGLYDLVNGVFYTNAGTGNFIIGGNV